MKRRAFVAVMAVVLTTVFVGSAGDAWARVRGGGSRGSRSFSTHTPSPAPSAPRVPSVTFKSAQGQPGAPEGAPSSAAAMQPSAPAVPRPGFFSSVGTAVAGYALGGFLGGMLFGAAGRGFGIGALDVLLVCGVLFVLGQFLIRRKRDNESENATAGLSGATAEPKMPVIRHGGGDVASGLGSIRRADPGFDSDAFVQWARTYFGIVQNAIAIGDVGIVRNRLTSQMYGLLQAQCHELRALHRTEYGVNADLSRIELTDAWQENGNDFATISFAGSMLHYTVDDASGEVIKGSKTEPQPVEESWIFTRPVGPGNWKLAAIQRA